MNWNLIQVKQQYFTPSKWINVVVSLANQIRGQNYSEMIKARYKFMIEKQYQE